MSVGAEVLAWVVVSMSEFVAKQGQLLEFQLALKMGRLTDDVADFYIDEDWIDLHSDFDYVL